MAILSRGADRHRGFSPRAQFVVRADLTENCGIEDTGWKKNSLVDVDGFRHRPRVTFQRSQPRSRDRCSSSAARFDGCCRGCAWNNRRCCRWLVQRGKALWWLVDRSAESSEAALRFRLRCNGGCDCCNCCRDSLAAGADWSGISLGRSRNTYTGTKGIVGRSRHSADIRTSLRFRAHNGHRWSRHRTACDTRTADLGTASS